MKRVAIHAAALAILLLQGCAGFQRIEPQAAAEPGMMFVREGRFVMGRDEGELNERPAHKVAIRDFSMDRTEVSAAEFAAFLNAAGNPGERYFTPDEHATVVAETPGGSDKTVRYLARAGYERYPANNVSWEGASAYCRWKGKRLPTEAEWEKAARGPDRRLFPWGQGQPGEGLAQFEQVWEEKKFDVLVPVDAYPAGASPYGMLNMSGNVLEWVDDWYRQNLCDFCNPYGETNLELIRVLTGGTAANPDPDRPDDTATAGNARGAREPVQQAPPRVDPTGPAAGTFKVLRGGSWQDRRDDDLLTTRRFWLDPLQRFPNTGFRCSKEPARQP